MKKSIKKLLNSKKLNHYCVNVLSMYNFGRVNIPAIHKVEGSKTK